MLDSCFQRAVDLHVRLQGSSQHLSENSLRYFADQPTLWTGFHGRPGWSPVFALTDSRSITLFRRCEAPGCAGSQGPSSHYSLSSFTGCLQPHSCSSPLPLVMYLPVTWSLVLIVLPVGLKALIWKGLFSSLED